LPKEKVAEVNNFRKNYRKTCIQLLFTCGGIYKEIFFNEIVFNELFLRVVGSIKIDKINLLISFSEWWNSTLCCSRSWIYFHSIVCSQRGKFL